jgi:hypothetical protein
MLFGQCLKPGDIFTSTILKKFESTGKELRHDPITEIKDISDLTIDQH